MLVEQQVVEEGDVEVHGEEVNDGDTAKGDVRAAHGEVPTIAKEPSIPSPTPPSDETMMDDVSNQGRMIAEMNQDADVVLEDDKEVTDEAKEVVEDAKEDETEPAEVQKVVDVVTTAK
uniref:Uncharacterized protein n=1 Tax=Tanacetum cinerariifolium TaxID=118510 RepID=A0A699T9Z1_TANCI|nr:hypothetical protein [Tanacetum cinerariifolium]